MSQLFVSVLDIKSESLSLTFMIKSTLTYSFESSRTSSIIYIQ